MLGAAMACGGPQEEAVRGEPGMHLPGLTDAQVADFFAGQALFNEIFTPEEGLGPLFNENQCSACHTDPAIGGVGGFERVIKATRFENGVCDYLVDEGGENLRKRATPLLQAHGVFREEMPPSATEQGLFITPPLFGLGLVEAIPAQTILAAEDPDDADGDGISGRAGRTPSGGVGRFSKKAELATIFDFVEGAARLEMGLTTPLKPEEETINGVPIPPDTDPAPDPEINLRTLELLSTFVRYLVPVAPTRIRSAAHADTLARGRQLFEDLGCARCHTPAMRTGSNDVAALHEKTVELYSDLLLHDMGPGLAGVCGFTATPTEYRTEMLMGLRHRDDLLHDGRARNITDAILGHGGEAEAARNAFAATPFGDQHFLLQFLESL